MKKTALFLFGIMVLAAVLRLWQLGNVPPSPDWDEAALGYNAYSIMQTGRDEYGKLLPFVLRSFDDYKPALYAYLIIPFIKLFGLNIIAVRLPSAIFGILAVFGTYFLVKELFKSSKIALLTSFLLAISPWHIQFSRIGFESQVGTCFNILATLFFLKGLRRPQLLLFSVVLYASNLYIYQSEKVFVPLLFLALAFIFRKELFGINKKYLVTVGILGLLIVLPMVHFTLTNKDALARARGVSVFSESTQLLADTTKRLLEDKQNNDVVGLIFDNRRIIYIKSIIAGYIAHFDLNWLFITGDITRHHAPGMGLLYLWELPFLLVGIYVLIFGSKNNGFDTKTKAVIFSWFLIAPISASITSGVPHAVRTLNFLPTFQIFIALGIFTVFTQISNIKYQVLNIRRFRYLLITCFLLLATFNILYYINQYFVQQNYYTSEDWQYGYKEAVEQVKAVQNRYDKIIVSNKPYLDQSYIFFLFYLEYPPDLYQKESQFASGGFRENHAFGKYAFRPIVWEKEIKNSKTLYVGLPEDFSDEAKVIKLINFLDGKPAIKIVEG